MEQNLELIGAWIAEADEVKRHAAEAREFPIVEANITEMEQLLISSKYVPPQRLLDSFFDLARHLKAVKSRLDS